MNGVFFTLPDVCREIAAPQLTLLWRQIKGFNCGKRHFSEEALTQTLHAHYILTYTRQDTAGQNTQGVTDTTSTTPPLQTRTEKRENHDVRQPTHEWEWFGFGLRLGPTRQTNVR